MDDRDEDGGDDEVDDDGDDDDEDDLTKRTGTSRSDSCRISEVR